MSNLDAFLDRLDDDRMDFDANMRCREEKQKRFNRVWDIEEDRVKKEEPECDLFEIVAKEIHKLLISAIGSDWLYLSDYEAAKRIEPDVQPEEYGRNDIYISDEGMDRLAQAAKRASEAGKEAAKSLLEPDVQLEAIGSVDIHVGGNNISIPVNSKDTANTITSKINDRLDEVGERRIRAGSDIDVQPKEDGSVDITIPLNSWLKELVAPKTKRAMKEMSRLGVKFGYPFPDTEVTENGDPPTEDELSRLAQAAKEGSEAGKEAAKSLGVKSGVKFGKITELEVDEYPSHESQILKSRLEMYERFPKRKNPPSEKKQEEDVFAEIDRFLDDPKRKNDPPIDSIEPSPQAAEEAMRLRAELVRDGIISDCKEIIKNNDTKYYPCQSGFPPPGYRDPGISVQDAKTKEELTASTWIKTTEETTELTNFIGSAMKDNLKDHPTDIEGLAMQDYRRRILARLGPVCSYDPYESFKFSGM